MIKVSVIIPCFNSGEFLLEAINSVKSNQTKFIYEIIIVDDGSFEAQTLNILNDLKSDFLVLSQKNSGPASARNLGVKYAKGEYLLFLDSDNLLQSNYIEKTTKIMEENPLVGIIYTNVGFFGEDGVDRFQPDVFDIKKILFRNYIDMCSLIRKAIFKKIGGLDESRVLIGREDWEFWIRAYKKQIEFYFLNEKLYKYRLRNDSLIITSLQNNKADKSYEYIYKKHFDTWRAAYHDLFLTYLFYQNDQNRPFRSFVKFMIRLWRKK